MPVVACYCQDFLKADMQHVHRQIVSLNHWQPAVITQKRTEAVRFPFNPKRLTVLPPLPHKNLRRWWWKHIRREPLAIPPARVRLLLDAVFRTEASVVHIFFGHIAVLLRPFLRACPRPVVVSFHGADAGVDMQNPAHQRALASVFDRASLVFARSQALLDNLHAAGCPQDKLRLQRTGIPLDDWPFSPRTIPADGSWHFLQTCRLVPKKGLLTSLRAFANIASKLPAARLTLAGDGPMRADLAREAASLGIADRVSFPGFLDGPDLRKLTESAHLFFHPSETPADGNREGVPNSMLEAMASGLPILATHHGGIPEAVEHSLSGFLAPERDHLALAEAALHLTSNPAAYHQMAATARLHAEQKFERARQTAILENLYAEAAARGVPPRRTFSRARIPAAS